MTHVQEINRIEELGQFRADWRRLLAQTAAASFFQTLDWLEVYWRHYGADQKLRALIVSSSGRPVGIVPLVVRSERTKVGTVRVLTYPLHDWGSFYGPIGPDPGAALTAALQHVRHSHRDWDTIDLRWAGATAQDAAETAKAMGVVGFQAYKTLWDRTALVELGDTWEEYLAGRSSKWRNNFRRQERRLAEQGRVSYLRYRPRGALDGDGDPRWDLYNACAEIARRSWQGSSATGTTLSHPSVRAYLRDAHAAAARAGGVDLNLLLLDAEPVAFAYNYCWGGHVYGLRAGYDGERALDGAGSLLFTYALRDGFQRGDHTYDFGVGSLALKRHFVTRVAPIFCYSHFHPAAPRAQLLRLKRWAQQRLSEADKAAPLASGI